MFLLYAGNSAVSTMEALFQVHLLETGEVYDITMPDMGIRGILLGSIMTEFAGKSSITCAKTGYRYALIGPCLCLRANSKWFSLVHASALTKLRV